MPKRSSIPLAAVADWDWLCQCAVRAARAKRDRTTVKQFFGDFESSIADVREVLLQGKLPHGSYTRFVITDPKPRLIHAAPFPDRVAHHALIGRMADRFETYWVPSSLACRPGKGLHAAIKLAGETARTSQWLVKLDVHSYFASISHDCLLQTLSRAFKGRGLSNLVEAVLGSYSTLPGTGLPIGSLTSQYFANHFLDGFQRHLRGNPSVRGELRYMDDVLIGCDTRAEARAVVTDAQDWLLKHRELSLKPAIIQRSSIGVPFCGFRVSSRGVRLGVRRRRAIRRHFRQLADRYAGGDFSETTYQQRLCAVVALASPGNHRHLLRQWVDSGGVDRLA